MLALMYGGITFRETIRENGFEFLPSRCCEYYCQTINFFHVPSPLVGLRDLRLCSTAVATTVSTDSFRLALRLHNLNQQHTSVLILEVNSRLRIGAIRGINRTTPSHGTLMLVPASGVGSVSSAFPTPVPSQHHNAEFSDALCRRLSHSLCNRIKCGEAS